MAAKKPEKPKKQAVLLIHGIGEQRPMSTLRGFVNAVWKTDIDVHGHPNTGVFSKPDEISENFELRRLTTTQDKNGIRTDFYEYYWAYMVEGTNLLHVLAWAKTLLLRPPWKVPAQLLGAWTILAGSLLLALVFFILQTFGPESYRVAVGLPSWLTGALGLVAPVVVFPLINNIVGDAARYLLPTPGNIKNRQAIRTRGIELLDKLHDSGKYNRILVVGHSLGSVIGYDILSFAWSLYNRKFCRDKPNPILDELEKDVDEKSLDVHGYREKQRALQMELATRDCPWLVTDFLTLGSPLAHAEVLLANHEDDLRSKQAERELPTCPPQLEKGKFSYPSDHTSRTLHHAAVFGPTRWTNLYFPSRMTIFGDIVGGPLQPAFGWGIHDCAVKTRLRGGFFSHTLYWNLEDEEEPGSHIEELRKALNLLND